MHPCSANIEKKTTVCYVDKIVNVESACGNCLFFFYTNILFINVDNSHELNDNLKVSTNIVQMFEAQTSKLRVVSLNFPLPSTYPLKGYQQ